MTNGLSAIMIRTIRTKLFMGFLTCIGVPAALGPIMYDYHRGHDALDTASVAIDQARLDLQRTYQFTRDFINFGQRDVGFFEVGNSEHLAKRTESLEATYSSLAKLRGVSGPSFHPTIDRITETLASYELVGTDLVQRLRERGFQDFGHVGRMRDAIHNIEADVESPELMVHLLTLRRHEKDYVIRNQTRYVNALRSRAHVLVRAIASDENLSQEERDSLTARLQDYVTTFEELVDRDQIIGVRGGIGLFSQLGDLERGLAAGFDELEEAFNGYRMKTAASLTTYLWSSFGTVVGLSVLLGLILSRRLTAPLHALSEKMQGYVESQFKRDADLGQLVHEADEVGQIAHDFGELQKAIREYVSSIRRMAYFDSLTGAASRAYFNQRLNEMIGTASRREEGFSLFFVDLDAFKDVNDGLGHDAGDRLLVELTERLTGATGDRGFVARLGGDEFCVLLDDVYDEADVAVVAERCIASIEEPVTINGKTLRPQASIGISRFPADGSNAEELMQSGDNAMYAAKAASHHRFEFHRKEMTQKAIDRLTIAQELRAAFANDEFLLHYQPQIDVKSGQISGWEALVRWQHPKRGMVPPNDFIPEIERLGLVNELGNWVIREACNQLKTWGAQGFSRTRVSVNVAPRQLTDTQLFDTVSQALSSAGVDPSQLELEVTETGIQSAPDSRQVLERLKQLGVRVAIDDFGTGYSSLGSLKHLPIDCLKIDQSFVRDMASNSQDAVLLGTIMALGHALNFEIVAEGVEELEQVQILQGLDCDMVQGYYFSRPMPPEEVPRLMESGFVESGNGKASAPPAQRTG